MNAEDMPCKVPESPTTDFIPPPLGLQDSLLQDTFLLRKQECISRSKIMKQREDKNFILKEDNIISLTGPRNPKNKTKKPQLHSWKRKP
jgi:hypothetical protein